MNPPFVIAGLDPAIHTEGRHALRFIMDARVKPAHDDGDLLGRVTNEKIQRFMLLNRNRSFFSLPQAAEKSSFFRPLVQMNRYWKPMNLNQKVKP